MNAGPAEDDLVVRLRGCLFGGGVGDALGAPVEFMTLAQIRGRFDANGVTGMVEGARPAGSVTDDTQMTLFTAEGLMRADVGGASRGVCHVPTVVDHALARWLSTQGEVSRRWDDRPADGRLMGFESYMPGAHRAARASRRSPATGKGSPMDELGRRSVRRRRCPLEPQRELRQRSMPRVVPNDRRLGCG
jgi:hypothetical protein